MIDSPCNDICTEDTESGLCVGCGRTKEEIANWFFYNDEQKKQVLLRLENQEKIKIASTSQTVLNNKNV